MRAEVYTTASCAYCPMVKKYLQMKGVPFKEIDAEKQENRVKAYELSAAATVPVTVFYIGEALQNVVVGWNAGKFAEIIN